MEIAANPVFHPSKPTKILFSPGYGAGWVSWAPRSAPDAFLVWMLTYEPLIEALEKRCPHGEGSPKEPNLSPSFVRLTSQADKLEDIMTQFHWEAHAKFGIDRVVTSRVGDLFVEEVTRPFEVRECDGSEAVVDVSRRRNIVIGLPTSEGAMPPAHASAPTPAPPAQPVLAAPASRDGNLATASGKRPSNVGISLEPPAKASTPLMPAPSPAATSVTTQNAAAAAAGAAAASSKTNATSADASVNLMVPPKPSTTPANSAAAGKSATVDSSAKPVASRTAVPPVPPPPGRDPAPAAATSDVAAKNGSGKSPGRTLSSKAGAIVNPTQSQAPPAGRGPVNAVPPPGAPSTAKMGK